MNLISLKCTAPASIRCMAVGIQGKLYDRLDEIVQPPDATIISIKTTEMTTEYDFSIKNLHIDRKRSPSSGTPLKTRSRKRGLDTHPEIQQHPNKFQKLLPSTSSSTVSTASHGTAAPTVSVFSPELSTRRKKTAGFRPLSTIERLPYDILEQIFLECLNVNFPRALQRVGQVLSTERTYRHFAYSIYCARVHANAEGNIYLASTEALRGEDSRHKFIAHREAMLRARSAGLTW